MKRLLLISCIFLALASNFPFFFAVPLKTEPTDTITTRLPTPSGSNMAAESATLAPAVAALLLAAAAGTVCAGAGNAAVIVVDIPSQISAVNELIMGCHSDSGYAMQSQGFESQMVVGESFEATANVAPAYFNTTVHWNPLASLAALAPPNPPHALHCRAVPAPASAPVPAGESRGSGAAKSTARVALPCCAGDGASASGNSTGDVFHAHAGQCWCQCTTIGARELIHGSDTACACCAPVPA